MAGVELVALVLVDGRWVLIVSSWHWYWLIADDLLEALVLRGERVADDKFWVLAQVNSRC